VTALTFKIPKLSGKEWYEAILFIGGIAAVWGAIAWGVIDIFVAAMKAS
jgi:hypothetical protein